MYIHVDSTILLLYKFEIPGTLPFPVAGQLGLCLTWFGTPKIGFLAKGLIFYLQLMTHDTREAWWLVSELVSGKHTHHKYVVV